MCTVSFVVTYKHVSICRYTGVWLYESKLCHSCEQCLAYSVFPTDITLSSNRPKVSCFLWILLSVELSAAFTSNSTQINVGMTVWFTAMENYYLAAIPFYGRISCETISARIAGGSSNKKLEILEASRTVVCLYVYDSLQEGMFDVLCCLFIITQYQPMSFQYSWLSNK